MTMPDTGPGEMRESQAALPPADYSGVAPTRPVDGSSAGTTLLSIVVPTYNRAGMLARLLGVLAEDAEAAALPILVADNASSDPTLDVLCDFSERLPGLETIAQPTNVGGVENVRTVLRNAPATRFVWMLADDDLPAPGAVAYVQELLRRHDPTWLHLPHLWTSGDTVALASPCPAELQVFPGSRELFLAYHHWLTFISATVLRTETIRETVGQHPTENEWAPLMWAFRAALGRTCVVADRQLVVGTAGTSWEDKRVRIMTERVIGAYDETLRLGLSREEYGRSLDARYRNDEYFDCWRDAPLTVLIDAVQRFPHSAQLRRFLWLLARSRGSREALTVLDAACVESGSGAEAEVSVRRGEELFGAGRPQDAEELFAEAIRLHPTSAVAWNDLGVARDTRGDASAHEAFDVALDLDPHFADARLNRAHLALRAGDVRLAATDARVLLGTAEHRDAAKEILALAAADGGAEELVIEVPPIPAPWHELHAGAAA